MALAAGVPTPLGDLAAAHPVRLIGWSLARIEGGAARVGLTDTGRRSWLFVLLGLFLIGALRIACLLPKTFNADSS